MTTVVQLVLASNGPVMSLSVLQLLGLYISQALHALGYLGSKAVMYPRVLCVSQAI